MRVTLYACDRCNLQFVADEPPGKCPRCSQNYTGKVTIRLAGRDVEIKSVRLYGENPLRKSAARRGLESLRLGIRCPHGWVMPHLCDQC